METALGPPTANSARQAIHAIRGYEYQILAATLEWVDLKDNELIFLEVAEDYARVVGDDIEAIQVKATRGSVTLNTPAVQDAIESFVRLVEQNPSHNVQLRFLTTSPIGLEKSPSDRPSEIPALKYWQRVRAGRVALLPLREILERESSSEPVREFCKARNDEQLVADLIRRVTWDCDKPDTAILRRELEARVAHFLRTELGVPPQEAPPITDVLAYRVLQRSAMPDVRDRVLSRQELLQWADFSTRISLRRPEFERLLSSALLTRVAPTPGQAIVSTRPLERPPWIVDAAILPTPKSLIRREPLEALVQSALRATGICFVVGPTGTGKSILARCTADTFPGPQYWVDLRDAELSEANIRLKQVFNYLAEMGPATLMLKDLNCLAARSVQASLGEVVGAAQRRDMRIIVTTYGRPSLTVLNSLGVDAQSVVSSPNFDLEETRTLIVALGGDPAVWGQVAHLAGGGGHPQLTYAFSAGIAARGWPFNEISDLLARGFTNQDLEDEHSAIRANLIDGLREPSRDLLYRLSVTASPFERSLAISIGALEPPIERASESFDELADRWLETPTADRYRVSPLVSGLGRKMLSTSTQRRVHDKIATELTDGDAIDAGDIDIILGHALAGASQQSLFKLTSAIILAEDDTRQAIARHLVLFPALDTSMPVFPNDLLTSVVIRIAQLRLAVALDSPRRVDDIAQALLREMQSVPLDSRLPDFEYGVVLSILNNLGIAQHIRDWVPLLSRCRRLQNEHVIEDIHTPESAAPQVATLFCIGIAGLDSVKPLENVFDALSELNDSERREFLTPIDRSFQDYYFLIHHPWIAQSRQQDFDATAVADIYTKMGVQADSWGIPAISVQCCIAVAMILGEQLGELTSALDVLDEAVAKFGYDVVLARALGKLHRLAGNATEALRHFRNAASQMQELSSVDAVYAVREAAICAAEGDEWNTARTWFLDAQAASEPLDSIGLGAIGVGLLADAAVASFRSGNLRNALELFKDALHSLREIEPDANLQAAHCHRLVRHTILWLQAKVEELDIEIAGKPISIYPGACSNPEPVPAIEQHPLGHIDFAWYMLAEIEVAAGLDVGIREIVKQLGTQGHIPLSEHALRTRLLGAAISAQDPNELSLQFWNYLTSSVYCFVNRDSILHSLSVVDPHRVVIPDLPRTERYDPALESSAQHAILAYGIQSLFVGSHEAVDRLRDSLTDEFGDTYPGASVFRRLDTPNAEANDLDGEVASILRRFFQVQHPPPIHVFLAGLRLSNWLARSPFKSVLVPQLKPWLSAHWRRILQTQRFLLRSPATTVPPIVEVLSSDLEGEPLAANLTLVAEAAVGAHLSSEIRQDLQQIASGV